MVSQSVRLLFEAAADAAQVAADLAASRPPVYRGLMILPVITTQAGKIPVPSFPASEGMEEALSTWTSGKERTAWFKDRGFLPPETLTASFKFKAVWRGDGTSRGSCWSVPPSDDRLEWIDRKRAFKAEVSPKVTATYEGDGFIVDLGEVLPSQPITSYEEVAARVRTKVPRTGAVCLWSNYAVAGVVPCWGLIGYPDGGRIPITKRANAGTKSGRSRLMTEARRQQAERDIRCFETFNG
jgi:hypothetical protein